jgi:hypothetical protein
MSMMMCLMCGEMVMGPAIRVRHGFVEYQKRGTVFHEDVFEDGDGEKWAHPACMPEVAIGKLEIERCTLCGPPPQQFYYGGDADESVLYLEGGDLTDQGFAGIEGGIGHFLCVCEEWNIPIQCLHGDLA